MFDLEEKLDCARFGNDLVKYMEGKGEAAASILKFLITGYLVIISTAL